MDWSNSAPRNGSSKSSPHVERILPFPGVAHRELRTIEVSPFTPGDEHDGPRDILCDLSAYRPVFSRRHLDRELDKMQASLDALKDDVDHFRFPGRDDDDSPRHAA